MSCTPPPSLRTARRSAVRLSFGCGRRPPQVLLRKSAQSASCFQATIPAEEPASLPGQSGEEPLDAEDTEDYSQRAAEGGCAAPAPSCSERLGGRAARDATLPESRSPSIPFNTEPSQLG